MSIPAGKRSALRTPRTLFGEKSKQGCRRQLSYCFTFSGRGSEQVEVVPGGQDYPQERGGSSRSQSTWDTAVSRTREMGTTCACFPEFRTREAKIREPANQGLMKTALSQTPPSPLPGRRGSKFPENPFIRALPHAAGCSSDLTAFHLLILTPRPWGSRL